MFKLIFFGLISIALMSCKQPNSRAYSGYIDTDLVYLSADFGGRLVDLAVFKGQLVKTNQFLFKLEQTSENFQREISTLNTKDLLAQRQQILAQINYSDKNYRRTLRMRKKNAASENDLDLATRELEVQKQQLAELDWKIENSKVDTADKIWRISRKENFAPQRGIIFDTYYKKGEFVPAGYPVLSLIFKSNVKTVFFVPEEALVRIRRNAPVKIISSNNSLLARGHIFYVSNIAEYTPPIIYSQKERQKLVFRVEAKIDTPALEKLHLGQPVTLELINE